MTYGASRLDLLLIERLILYLLTKRSGSISAENICIYICSLRIFLKSIFKLPTQIRSKVKVLTYIPLTKVTVLVADRSIHFPENDMMTCVFQVLAISYVGQ